MSAAGERVAAAQTHTAAATVVGGGICVDRSRGAGRRGGDLPVTVIGTIRSAGDLLAPLLQLSARMLQRQRDLSESLLEVGNPTARGCSACGSGRRRRLH